MQIGQGSGVLSGSSAPSTSRHLIATVTVNQGTTVVITSLIPSESRSISPSPMSGAQPAADSVGRSPSFWDSAGKVAGVFVAVGVIAAILALTIFWICRSKRNRQDEEKPGESSPSMARRMSGSESVSRSTSLLQLLGKRERNRSEDNALPTSIGNHRLSRSPTELVVPVVDQRLDPQSVMIRFDDNDSRTSFRDEEDYSRRVWRVTNVSDSDSLRSSAT
jgi:cell wall integrity and stress response component